MEFFLVTSIQNSLEHTAPVVPGSHPEMEETSPRMLTMGEQSQEIYREMEPEL